MLKSRHEHEVERINIYQDRFLVAHTAQTLMLGDLQSCQLSEVSWETTGSEKFHFDNPQVPPLPISPPPPAPPASGHSHPHPRMCLNIDNEIGEDSNSFDYNPIEL